MTDACFGGIPSDFVMQFLFLLNFRVQSYFGKEFSLLSCFFVLTKFQGEAASRLTRDVTVSRCLSALCFKLPLWLRV